MGMTTTGNTTMRKRIAAVLAALGLALVMALVNPSAAQAAQSGLQQVYVTTESWSVVYVNFACGLSYNVPVGATWGEGRPKPQCGSYAYQAEPSSVWVGPGWCLTRSIPAVYGGDQYLWGGGSGHWFQLWQPGTNYNRDYTNRIAAWYGSWCPTSGAAGASGYPYTY